METKLKKQGGSYLVFLDGEQIGKVFLLYRTSGSKSEWKAEGYGFVHSSRFHFSRGLAVRALVRAYQQK